MACPNSLAAQEYALAAVSDLLAHFPEADGLMLDWVEFGAYRLEDLFMCFCPHCERAALAAGFDWPGMRRAASALWGWLHTLDANGLARARRVAANFSELLELLGAYPGWVDLLRFKAASVAGVYRRIRACMDEVGRPNVGLVARGWCPPWNPRRPARVSPTSSSMATCI